MKECYLCGVGENTTVLYEGISKEGIVNVCRKCYFKNKIPLVTKKEVSMEELPGESVRARLSRMAGVQDSGNGRSRVKTNMADVSLRDIIEKNFREKISGEKKAEDIEGLVANFHWVVMRKRRQKKISQKELAETILEPVSAIEYLEKGILPKEYVKLIRKVERVLGVQLLIDSRKVFDPSSLAEEAKVGSDFTIGELKDASEKRGFMGFFRRRDKELEKDIEDFSREGVNSGVDAEKEFNQVIQEAFEFKPVVEKREGIKKELRESTSEEIRGSSKKDYSGKKDLSQKEIDDLLFGRK